MDIELFQKSFLQTLNRNTQNSVLQELKLSSFFETSIEMDRYPFQDASRFRSRLLGLNISNFLIADDGEFSQSRLKELSGYFQKRPYILAPIPDSEAPLFAHVLKCLMNLEENPKLIEFLKKFSPPVCHKRAEKLIRETLEPHSIIKVRAADMRRAVLAAWFTPLRQVIGSCFATAPAILVQRDHPFIFFQDLYDLLSTGQMKRVCQGKEYSIPLSPSMGAGDLMNLIPSMDSLEFMAFAPGIVQAFDSAGILPSSLNYEEKGAFLKEIFKTIKPQPETYENFFRRVLLKSFQISEKEIEEEEELKKLQMTLFFARRGEVYYEKQSEKGKKIAEFKLKLKKAKEAFRSMTECSLLRSWEYSIASFCDVKTEFSRWNLFIGLGLHPDQKGGIGHFLYSFVNTKLQEANTTAKRFQQEYDGAVSQVRSLESLLHRSLSESHRIQLKSELQSAIHAAETAIHMRDSAIDRASALAMSFSSLIQQLDTKLQEEFQEIFDPALKREESALCDDSPAGFRLVYKHRRTDASLWTFIYTDKDYLQSLREFFSSVEPDLSLPPPLDRSFLSEIISGLLHFLNEEEFLRNAFDRSRSHGRTSPWEYVSGGTMQMLVQNYWSRAFSLTEVLCHAESEKVLYVFLNDLARKLKDPLLMHSPTHAFVFYPNWMKQEELLNIEASRKIVEAWKLNYEKKEYIGHQLARRLPSSQRSLFLHLFVRDIPEGELSIFRAHLVDCLKEIRIKNPIQEVDSVLFEHFSLLSLPEAKVALQHLLKPFLKSSFTVKWQGNFFRTRDLLLIAKEVLLEKNQEIFTEFDWDLKLVKRMRELGCAYPAPMFFADTNWSGWLFGWIFNLATYELELWRLNRTATMGYPMSEWKPHFSTQKDLPWVVLSNPREYRG